MGGFPSHGADSRRGAGAVPQPLRPYFAEFTAVEHPADERYLRDIEGERPSAAAQARELWLQTEILWTRFPDFIRALCAAASSRSGA